MKGDDMDLLESFKAVASGCEYLGVDLTTCRSSDDLEHAIQIRARQRVGLMGYAELLSARIRAANVSPETLRALQRRS